MKRSVWLGLCLVVLASFSAFWFLKSNVTPPLEDEFRMVSLENNVLLISDADILSYNWTSQEIAITDVASERLVDIGDSLYSFDNGFVITIDGEEVYRGVFRTAVMSAIPSPPRVSILFPSMLFPSETENHNIIRMFYPGFEPPSDQLEANARFFQYFEDVDKLTY